MDAMMSERSKDDSAAAASVWSRQTQPVPAEFDRLSLLCTMGLRAGKLSRNASGQL
jgi:hypothetical protein